MPDASTWWIASARGIGRRTGETIHARIVSADRPTLEDAAFQLLQVAAKGRLVPTGAHGASNVDRLLDFGFSSIALEAET